MNFPDNPLKKATRFRRRFVHPARFRRKASSLVTALLVLVVLSTIVVAFMQSMSVERMTAKSSANRYKAELAAEAGLNAARWQLITLFSRYPDSATAWQQIPSGNGTEGTIFHFRGAPLLSGTPSATNLPDPASPAIIGNNLRLYTWPLISGATPSLYSGLDSSFSTALSTNNSIDLNRNNWVGTAKGQPRKVLNAQWIYLTNNKGETNARYAYWVDDESFRLNVNSASETVRGTNSGASPDQIPAQAVLASAANQTNGSALASSMVSKRQSQPFMVSSQVSYVGITPADQTAMSTDLRFVATPYSASLNISRGGWKRVNINALFSTAASTRTQLDRFIATITNSNASPQFGQRFYRSGSVAVAAFTNTLNDTNFVTSTHALIYLNKLAANTKDYIDTDNQPTLINNDYPTNSVRGPSLPTEALEPLGGGLTGDNPVIAIGQENTPKLQEYALHARVISMSPVGWSGSRGTATFSFTLDHYFEFYNMGVKDITISDLSTDTSDPEAFLTIYNQPSIGNHPNAGSFQAVPVVPEGRPITIYLRDIPNLIFRAGKTTVITTDPNPNTKLVSSGTNVFIAPVAYSDRRFNGTTRDSATDHSTDSFGNTFNNTYRVLMSTRTSGDLRTDYETCVFLGNNHGLLESFCALPIARSTTSGYGITINAEEPDRIDSEDYFVRGGTPAGNSSFASGAHSISGDPRALNEQLTMMIYTPVTLDSSAMRFINTLNNADVPGQSTLGSVNTNRVDPTKWPDYSVNSDSPSNAPSYVANNTMQSISEFGNLYDPSRILGTASAMPYAQGGGRTLKVGQSDQFNVTTSRSGLWDGSQTNASRTWAAWRITDFFSTTNAWKIEGAYNINGAKRDGGLVLRSIIDGFRYQDSPTTPANLAGLTLTAAQQTNFSSAVIARLDGANLNSANDDQIFWERGELSELMLLGNGTTLTGQNMSQTLDRGREELVRRLIQMVTTRGSVFSVYVVGQSVKTSGGLLVPVSTAQLKVTLDIDAPTHTQETDDFDPYNNASIASRFQSITNFSTRETFRAFQ